MGTRNPAGVARGSSPRRAARPPGVSRVGCGRGTWPSGAGHCRGPDTRPRKLRCPCSRVGHRLDGATLPPAEAAPYSLKLTLRHSWGGGSTAARRACFPEALGTGFSAPAPAPRRHPWPGSRIRGTESSLGICVGVKPAVSPWSCLPRAGSRELLLDTALRGPWGCPSPGQVCGGRWGACLPPADACARAWGGAGAGSAGSGAAGGAGWGLWRADAAFVLFPPSVHPDRKSVPFQDALQRGRRGR